MSDYPQHDKLEAHLSETRILGEFLDWLEEQGFEIARHEKQPGINEPVLTPLQLRPDQLIGSFLEIDPVALEMEKRAMLDEMRRINAASPPTCACGCGATVGCAKS